MSETPVCIRCGSEKLAPSQRRRRTPGARWCSRCLNSLPSAKAARARYMRRFRQTAKGRVAHKRRVRYGDTSFGYAQTHAQAEQIKAHIRRRMADFHQRHSQEAS